MMIAKISASDYLPRQILTRDPLHLIVVKHNVERLLHCLLLAARFYLPELNFAAPGRRRVHKGTAHRSTYLPHARRLLVSLMSNASLARPS